jgi:hypothetical protein
LKRIFFALSLFAICAFGQTAGTIVTTPPTAPTPAVVGKVVATAGTVNCTLTGNAAPATAVLIACTVAGVVIAPYSMPPLGANSGYSFTHSNLATGDAITAILKADGSKAITADVVATTAAGSAQTPTPAKF